MWSATPPFLLRSTSALPYSLQFMTLRNPSKPKSTGWSRCSLEPDLGVLLTLLYQQCVVYRGMYREGYGWVHLCPSSGHFTPKHQINLVAGLESNSNHDTRVASVTLEDSHEGFVGPTCLGSVPPLVWAFSCTPTILSHVSPTIGRLHEDSGSSRPKICETRTGRGLRTRHSGEPNIGYCRHKLRPRRAPLRYKM